MLPQAEDKSELQSGESHEAKKSSNKAREHQRMEMVLKILSWPLTATIIAAIVTSIYSHVYENIKLSEQRISAMRSAAPAFFMGNFEEQGIPMLNFIASFGEESVPFLLNSIMNMEEVASSQIENVDESEYKKLDRIVILIINIIRRIRVSNNENCENIVDNIWKIILSTPNESLKARFIKHIGYFGEPSYENKLKRYLRDKHTSVRNDALIACSLLNKEGITFTKKDFDLIKGTKFTNIQQRLKIHFEDVQIPNSEFNDIKFDSLRMVNTNLNECVFRKCDIENGTFKNLMETNFLKFEDLRFRNTVFENVVFRNPDLIQVVFFDRCKFVNVDFSSVNTRTLKVVFSNRFYMDEKSQESFIKSVMNIPSENRAFIEYLKENNKKFE
jgi:hypothetical protein